MDKQKKMKYDVYPVVWIRGERSGDWREVATAANPETKKESEKVFFDAIEQAVNTIYAVEYGFLIYAMNKSGKIFMFASHLLPAKQYEWYEKHLFSPKAVKVYEPDIPDDMKEFLPDE